MVHRAVLESTEGPVEHAHVRCVQRHHFCLPVAYLAREPLRAVEPMGSRAREVVWPVPDRVRAGS